MEVGADTVFSGFNTCNRISLAMEVSTSGVTIDHRKLGSTLFFYGLTFLSFGKVKTFKLNKI